MTKEEILEMLEKMRQNTINAYDYNDPQRDRKRIALDVAIKAVEQQEPLQNRCYAITQGLFCSRCTIENCKRKEVAI